MELYTTQEACQKLRISRPTLYRYIAKGYGPRARRLQGAPTLYTQEAIDEWFDFTSRHDGNPNWKLWLDFIEAWKNREVSNLREFLEKL